MSRDEENIDEPDLTDGGGLEAADPKHPAPQKKPGEPADPEDLLFEAPEQPEEVSEEFGGRRQFSEGSGAKWGGAGMDADEIGIPIEQEPGYMASDDDFALDSEQELELELVDDESQLDQEGTAAPVELEANAEADAEGFELGDDEDLVLDDDAVFAEAAETVLENDDGADPSTGEFFVLDEAERSGQLLRDEPLPTDSYPVEEGWEPVGQEGEAGGEWSEAEAGATPAHAGEERLDLQPSLVGATNDELEEQYYEEEAPAVIAAAPRRSGRLLRMMTSMAAAAMVVGAGAVVVLRPEWLGLHFEPQLVERVQVARPNLDLRVPTPLPPQVATPKPPVEVGRVDPPVTPVGTEPTPKDPLATGPTVPTPPVDVEPTPTDPVAVTTPDDPTQAPIDPFEPAAQQPVAKAAELPRYLPVGDSMWIGDFDGRQRSVAEWAQVRLGAKAFAQLQNGNYFIGSVKAVNSSALILTVTDGEVTLLRDEVEKVATLDSEEYAQLQQATTGFLRLSNRNRLVGAILKSVVDDNYVLQMRSDRIVVPRSAVEQVVSQPGMDGLRFGSANDEEEWLRGIASQQLRAMSTGVPASPGGEGRRPAGQPKTPAKGQPKLPVKEVGRKAPVERPDGK